MDPDALIYKSILDNMNSGVMTLDSDGHVMTFNPAASRILGLSRDEVVGRPFAAVFMTLGGMDDFNQAILDAVYDVAINRQQVVEIRLNDTAPRSLALMASYLHVVQNGETRRIGVVALFNDITEVKELREAEVRLAESVKVQHAKLQDAYHKIEENNLALASAMKRGRIAAGAIISLFLALGLYAWDTNLSTADTRPSASVPDAPTTTDLRTVVVAPQRLSSTISLVGQLAPHRKVSVTSPISGTVAATYFQYGEEVAKGQRLIDLDTTKVEQDYREAQAAHIKALKRFNEVEDWDNNIEVSRARRSITRAKMALEAQKDKLEETSFLLEQGLIPTSEHEAAARQYHNQQLDYEAAQVDLAAVLVRGGADEKRVARLELENARTRMQILKDTLEQARVTAPISGVVLQPSQEDKGRPGQDEDGLTVGRTVTQGERLLTIGDLDSLSVVGQVDEVDIVEIRPSQTVGVSGDAFHDLALHGTVVYVSSQATQNQGRQALPSFEIVVALENLSEAQRQRLRLGMSANLEVVMYDKPDALLVPISAVQTRSDGTWLRVRKKGSNEVRQVPVEVGLTTMEAVEILRGIEAGDEVVFSVT